MPRTLRLVNARSGIVVADRIRAADTFWSRLRGLTFVPRLCPGEGLLIEPCSSIHMLFMRFSIDAVFVDRESRVVKVASNVRPWFGIAAARGSRAVIELPAGGAVALQPGDTVRIEPND